jgi:CHAT domain-containing protein
LVRTDAEHANRESVVMRTVAELTDDPKCHALTLHACAQAMHVTGQYTQAVELYEQAEAIYERVGHTVEAARIVRAKVNALMYLGRYEEALLAANKARNIFQQHDERNLLAQLEVNVGNIYHRLDDYREALRCYDVAEQTFPQQNEFDLAQLSFNKANQYTQLNEFDTALALYEQARRGYEALDMPLLINQTEYSIAWLYFLRGRFQESLKLFAQTQARAGELGDTSLSALCDLDRAEVYLQLNMLDDALGSAQSAVEKFSDLQMNYERAKAGMYLGIAYTNLNDLPAAERWLQDAREGFLAEGNEVYTALTDIYLSDVFSRGHETEQALQLCSEARMLLGERDLSAKVAYAEFQQARLNLSQGYLDEASSLGQSALALLGEAEAPWLRYQIFHLLGNVEQHAGRMEEAYAYYNQAVEHLEAIRSGIRADEYKCAFMKDKLRVYEDLVGLCLKEGTEEKIDEAFAYVEAAKSRSLTELLAADRNIQGKTHEPSVAELYQQWNKLREELDYYYNRLNQSESRAEQRPGWLGVELHDEVRQREQQLSQLARRLSLEDAEYASLLTAPRTDTQRVRQCLGDDEVLIEYFFVNGEVKIFAFDCQTVRVFDHVAPVEHLASLLQWLKFYLDRFMVNHKAAQQQQASMDAPIRHYLGQLYTVLIAPVEAFVDGRKMIIAPHGMLHYIPFHALYDGQQYLVDRYEISYCPSASVYKLCVGKANQLQKAEGGRRKAEGGRRKAEGGRRKAEGRKRKAESGLKEITSSLNNPQSAIRHPQSGGVLIMGVPDKAAPLIREEVETVKSLWPEAQVFLDKEATLTCLQQQASTARFLHLATHGVFRRDNPMFSALKLSDTWLNLYDIFNLNLNADLVTLSACETGMNEVFPGDELFGLMRGFLYAGAPSLIVSLWVVHDRSTATFMQYLYAGLREGLSKRAALRHAQLAVKQEYQHPYFWAPFILMGAPA